MPHRYTNIRIVDPITTSDTIERRPFDLIWAALAAAEETMQGGPLTPAWLSLFQAHLSARDTATLRWREDLAESTEMRRAYSAMYGRFFSRALLASRFGFTNFVPLERNITRLGKAATVRRKKKGDIPDWIAWDPAASSYVLAEAKGCLTGRDRSFLYGTPTCIGAGKAQFDRVIVRNARGRKIRTRNWVAANLWATDVRGRRSVSVLWDPDEDGEELSDDDIPENATAIREHRINNIAVGLGRQGSLRLGAEALGQAVRIAIDPSGEDLPPEPPKEQLPPELPRQQLPPEPPTDQTTKIVSDDVNIPIFPSLNVPAREPHSDVYVAALVTPLGIRPILNREDFEAVRNVQRQVRDENGLAMIYGLSKHALAAKDYRCELWLSAGGIASPDGAGLFDLKLVQMESVT